jgi:hypothetical protein
MMYGSHNYSMGASDEALVNAAATAPITKAGAQQAKVELNRMRSALSAWLKYRAINDDVASGKRVPQAMLKKPGAKPMPPQAMALRLRTQRLGDEATLATNLHTLLAEVFDGATLPDPDLKKNPNAAVELAKIAIAGKLPSEASSPAAAGFIWMWPLVIVVGAIALVVMSKIRSDAEVAKEREHNECVASGACTDSGFWLKVAAVGFIGWLVWDRMGVGARVKKMGGRR